MLPYPGPSQAGFPRALSLPSQGPHRSLLSAEMRRRYRRCDVHTVFVHRSRLPDRGEAWGCPSRRGLQRGDSSCHAETPAWLWYAYCVAKTRELSGRLSVSRAGAPCKEGVAYRHFVQSINNTRLGNGPPLSPFGHKNAHPDGRHTTRHITRGEGGGPITRARHLPFLDCFLSVFPMFMFLRERKSWTGRAAFPALGCLPGAPERVSSANFGSLRVSGWD